MKESRPAADRSERRGGQQRQQADEGVAALLAKPESAQLGEAIGLQIGVAQLRIAPSSACSPRPNCRPKAR
jgi:hypothetical protein